MAHTDTTGAPHRRGPRQLIAGILAVAVLLAIHITLRCSAVEQYVGDDGSVFYCVDSFHHAHRTRLAWEQWPRLPFFDPYMNHPRGAVAEWPVGFDALVAAILVAAHAVGLDGQGGWNALSLALPFVNIAFGLIAVLAFVRILARFLPAAVSLVGGLLFSMNLGFVSVSAAGNYDHHGVEILGVVLIIAAALPRGALAPRPLAVALAAALSLAIWCSTFLAFILASSLSLRLVDILVRTRRGEDTADALPDPWFAVPLATFTLAVCFVEGHARSRFFSLETLSLLHWAVVAGLLAAQRLAPRIGLKATAAAALALAIVAAVLGRGSLSDLASYALGTGSLVSNINESQPIFFDRGGPTLRYVLAYFGPAYLLFPIVVIHARRKLPGDGARRHLVWFALLLFLLSLSQRRFLGFFTPAFVMLIAIWAWHAFAPGWPRRLVCAAAVAALALPLAQFGPRAVSAMSPSTREAIAVARHIAALPARTGFGVFAPPNLGSPITYIARRPTTSNAFYYRRYLDLDKAVRDVRTEAGLRDLLRANRIDTLVAADDVRYRTMLLDLWGEEDAARISADSDFEPCGSAHLGLAYYRLACRPSSVPGFELMRTWELGRDCTRLYRTLSLYRVLD